MILRYELPKEAEQVISLTDNERIYYAVPVDIDDAGNFLEDSFFIVTNRRLFVVEKDSIKQEPNHYLTPIYYLVSQYLFYPLLP